MSRIFGLSAVITTLGLALGACSPISPSVSKLAGYSSSESNSNDISLAGSVGGKTQLLNAEVSEEKEASLTVLNESDFSSSITIAKKERPTQELEDEQIEDLASNKETSIISTDKRISGQEAYLLNHSVNVYMAVDKMSADERDALKQQLKVMLSYEPSSEKSKSGSIHIRIAHRNASQDPVKALQDEKIDQDKLDSIQKVAVEFMQD